MTIDQCDHNFALDSKILGTVIGKRKIVVSGSYQIDTKQNLILIHSTGEVTVDEKISQDELILSDPKYKSNMNVICDLSEATYDWSLTDIDKFRNFVKRHKGKIGKSKWAVIAAGGATEHAAKIFSVLQTAYDNVVEVQVFNNRDKAVKWLSESTRKPVS